MSRVGPSIKLYNARLTFHERLHVPLPDLTVHTNTLHLGVFDVGWWREAPSLRVGLALPLTSTSSVTPLIITRGGAIGSGALLRDGEKYHELWGMHSLSSLSQPSALHLRSRWADETQRIIGRLSLGGLSWSDLVAQRDARSELGPIDAPLKMTGAYRLYTSDIRQWELRGVRREITLIGRHETSSWIDPHINMRGGMRDEMRGELRDESHDEARLQSALLGLWMSSHQTLWRSGGRAEPRSVSLIVSDRVVMRSQRLMSRGATSPSLDPPGALTPMNSAWYTLNGELESRSGSWVARLGGGDLRAPHAGLHWLWGGVEYTLRAHRTYQRGLHSLEIIPRLTRGVTLSTASQLAPELRGLGQDPELDGGELGVTLRQRWLSDLMNAELDVWWGALISERRVELADYPSTRIHLSRGHQEEGGSLSVDHIGAQGPLWSTRIRAQLNPQSRFISTWGAYLDLNWSYPNPISSLDISASSPLNIRVYSPELISLKSRVAARSTPVEALLSEPLSMSTMLFDSTESPIENPTQEITSPVNVSSWRRTPTPHLIYAALGLERAPLRLEWRGALSVIDLSHSMRGAQVSSRQTVTWLGECSCWSASLSALVSELQSTRVWRVGVSVRLGAPPLRPGL